MNHNSQTEHTNCCICDKTIEVKKNAKGVKYKHQICDECDKKLCIEVMQVLKELKNSGQL
jgi:hypothetical protein